MAAPSLANSVALLRSTTSTLSSSLQALQAGLADFPRLCTVLGTTRHFELIPEPQLLAAQASLRDSIRPEVEELLERVEAYVGRMERVEQGLIARGELLAGRLEGRKDDEEGSARAEKAAGGETDDSEEDGRPLTEAEVVRFKMIRAKRERLEFTVERLGLQAQQSERQLRKSMAAK